MKNQYPLKSLYIYLTNFCNLACRHCWVTPGKPDQISLDREVSCEELTSILKQAKKMGLAYVKITGGDPLLRPKELRHIVHSCVRLNVSTSIETNGVLMTSDLADEFIQANCSISMSIDSHKKEKHDAFRRRKGTFKSTLHSLSMLTKKEYPVSCIVMSIHRGNVDDIIPLAELLASYKVFSLKLNPVTPCGRGEMMQEKEELLHINEILEVTRKVDGIWKGKYPFRISIDVPVAFRSIEQIKNNGVRHCDIYSTAGISPNGDLCLCGIAKECPELGNVSLKNASLEEAWANAPFLKDLRDADLKSGHGICSKCMFAQSCCGHCAADIYHCNGSFSHGNSFCQEAYEKGLFPLSRMIE